MSIATATEERALLIPFVVTGTRALLAARRPDDAERWLARMREQLAGWEPIAGPALAHAEGLVALATGSLSAARDALERGIAGWEERGRTWEATWGRLDLAHALMRSNRFGEAAAQLAAYYTHKNGLLHGDFIGFGGMENVRFRGMVRPGDRLVLVGKATRLHRRQTIFSVQGFVRDAMVFHADVIGVPLMRKEEA